MATIELDEYEIVNLMEALRLAPANGDWHAQVWYKLKDYNTSKYPPNQTAEQMLATINNGLAYKPPYT